MKMVKKKRLKLVNLISQVLQALIVYKLQFTVQQIQQGAIEKRMMELKQAKVPILSLSVPVLKD